MARSVFFSFHYARDSWRVQQIANMGALEGQTILDAQEWEEVKRRGDQAIKNWIATQMAGKDAVVVLIGSQTANRRWVRYEIIKAWNEKKPLVGIHIHGLADSDGYADSKGANPFASIEFDSGGTIADYVPVHNPAGATSRDVHATIAANLVSWVNNAYRPS